MRVHDGDRGVARLRAQDLGRPRRPAGGPRPTASRQPTSERTMLWQKASARTVATARPASSRAQ